MRYIDADLLRKEIEKYYDEYRLKFNTIGDPYYLGLADGLDVATGVIDSLQQEQPSKDLKGAIREWVNLMVGASFPEQDGDYISEEDYRSVIRQTALHFYALGKQSKEPINEDLEEAAKEYATTHLRNNEFPTADNAFIAGAEWQKQQMLKDAVEGKVLELGETYKDLTISVEGKELNEALHPLGVKDGDKVKVIIVKEDMI